MASSLIITPVEQLQEEVISTVKSLNSNFSVYVSLNKTQKSIETALKDNNLDMKKIFFIDCVTSEKTSNEVIHTAPTKLNILSTVIHSFINNINEKKILVIDGLATLLIYNDENSVARFVKKVTEYASKNDVNVIAFSPKTEGDELLNKIFNFFDNVERKE